VSIEPHEQEILGNWFLQNGKVIADESCKRIHQLVRDYLVFIKTDETGWDKLYREPQNGRYWEKVYLGSEAHGGGPPSLRHITHKDAHAKYKLSKPISA